MFGASLFDINPSGVLVFLPLHLGIQDARNYTTSERQFQERMLRHPPSSRSLLNLQPLLFLLTIDLISFPFPSLSFQQAITRTPHLRKKPNKPQPKVHSQSYLYLIQLYLIQTPIPLHYPVHTYPEIPNMTPFVIQNPIFPYLSLTTLYMDF